MPIQVSYPGVYLEEIPGGQPIVAGVSTASTAFVDFFGRGPMNKAVRVASMQDVERTYGGLHKRSEASYGLRQYFLNGGKEAWIIRTGDGAAKRSSLAIAIKTPGLPARVRASAEEFQKAKEAADAANKAALAAADALSKLQDAGATDQEREQGQENLRGSTTDAASATQEAAAATRRAAVQAKAASDELAIAIAKVAAGSGPVADRTAMAAEKAAEAAQASADAAEQTSVITAVAERAEPVAGNALRIGASARGAEAAADQVLATLDAVDEAEKAAAEATKANEDFKDNENQELVLQAAGRAAAAAIRAADQAVLAARATLGAAQSMLERAKSTEGDIVGAKAAVDAAKEAHDDARQATRDASAADWDVQTAGDLDGAKTALQNASDKATASAEIAGAGDTPPEGSAKAIAVGLLTGILAQAVEAANNAAAVAAAETGEDPANEAVGVIVGDAIQAIDGAIQAAKDAGVAAKGGSEDAKVAADSVSSGGPALAARNADGAVTKAGKATQEAVETAKAVKLQINQANSAAMTAGPSAKKAAEAAGSPPEDPRDQAQMAADTAQKALNAADNSVSAAEAVEKAAVTIAQVSVQASYSADAAAQSAEAAVQANEEAAQEPTLIVEAIDEGIWGDNLEITLQVGGTNFALGVRELVVANGVTRQLMAESYNALTVDEESSIGTPALPVVNDASKMIRLRQFGPKIAGAWPEEVGGKFLAGGDDGGLANADQLTTAMLALDNIEPSVFNLLCLPSVANYNDAEASVAIAQAEVYASKKRAFFVADIPAKVDTVDEMLGWVNEYGNAKAYNMAVYFPRLVLPDPLDDYRPRNVGSSGTVAGIYARTDSTRGVWKAPAGVEAVIQGAEVAVPMNDDKNGLLNPRGVNVLRQFPVYGNIVWGARTLAGADVLSSEYKYINVRRLMNYTEESIFRSIKWAVFEPNNEVLWGKIRLQINSFLGGLFADGAFQGTTPAAAYFVRCDGTTTTPLDIDMGIVNVVVGIAPSKPAEFVILQFQQIAGQTA